MNVVVTLVGADSAEMMQLVVPAGGSAVVPRVLPPITVMAVQVRVQGELTESEVEQLLAQTQEELARLKRKLRKLAGVKG